MIEKIRAEFRINEASHRQLKKELKKAHRESSRMKNGGSYYHVTMHLQKCELHSKKLIRHYNLMLAFLDGKRYQEVEFNAKTLPNWFAIRDLLKEYLYDFRDASEFESKISEESPSMKKMFENKRNRRKIADDNFNAWVEDAMRHVQDMRSDEKE